MLKKIMERCFLMMLIFLIPAHALAIEWNTVTFNIPATSGNRVTINGSGTIHSVVYTLDSGSNGTFTKSSDFPLPETFVTTQVRTFTQFVVQSDPALPMPSNVSITVENVDTGATQTFTNGVYSNGTTPPSTTTMTLTATDNGDGSSDFTWSPVSGAYNYKLYVNGALSGTYSSSTTTVTEMVSDGTAQVMAYDMNGNLIGQSDTISFGSTTTEPPPDGGTGGTGGDTGGTTCGECEKLAEMLACPEWDAYMGEFTDAFAAAMPPPPDWDQITDMMRDKIVPDLINGMVDEVVPAMGSEMDRILGHPDAPPVIGTPNVPQMDGTSGVNRPADPVDSTPPAQTYNLDSIPSVQVEEDTTGGIDLSGADPIDSVPHTDENYMPMPGQETGGDQPMTKPIDSPTPTNQGTVEPPADATPTPTTSTAPTPTPSAPGPDASVTPPPAPDMPMPVDTTTTP